VLQAEWFGCSKFYHAVCYWPTSALLFIHPRFKYKIQPSTLSEKGSIPEKFSLPEIVVPELAQLDLEAKSRKLKQPGWFQPISDPGLQDLHGSINNYAFSWSSNYLSAHSGPLVKKGAYLESWEEKWNCVLL